MRQLFGYDRFADPRLIRLMNDLYANEFSLLTNFFYPTLKLKSKSHMGSRWVKKYSTPITPAQRLLDHPDVATENKIKLNALMKSLNPFDLQQRIQGKLRGIFKRLR